MAHPATARDRLETEHPHGRVTDRVSLTTLQTLQDRFAALGRMTVCISTVDGGLMTEPTWGSWYSELIGTSPRGRTSFIEAMGVLSQTRRTEAPLNCHEGMFLQSNPITHDNRTLGILVVGTRTHPPPPDDEVRKIARSYEVDTEDLLAAAVDLDPARGGTPEDIHRFADVLAHIIATLYGQADQIARQLDDLRTVHGLSDLLAGTLDLQQILDRTVRRVVEVMPVKACAIRLLNSETGELVIKAVHNLSEEYLRKGPVLLQSSLVDATAFAGHNVYIEDAPTDPRTRYPENARREGIVSGLCVPLTYRGQTIGVIRVYTAKRHVFTESEGSLLRSIGSQAASAIIHSRLFRERAEAERVQQQVEAAAQIQRRMLPAQPPVRPGLAFGCVYDPTLQVGGDFYDFIELEDGSIGLCIADVMGKGLPAALLMASTRSALRAFASSSVDLSTTVSRVNRHMHRDTPRTEFVTLVYAVLSSDGRGLTFCNAGHPPPLLLRGDRFVDLTTGGLAVGIQPDEVFEQELVALRPGDTLTMVTDGVTEALDFQGMPYGRERLLASIWKHRRLEAQPLAHQIHWDVRRFVGLAEQSDDITIVVVKVI